MAFARNACVVFQSDRIDEKLEPRFSSVDPAVNESIWQVCWQRWFAVETQRRVKNLQIHEANYQAVHRELLKATRHQACQTTGLLQDRFFRLIALVEPWLTSQSLAALDRKTLFSLFESCQELMRIDCKPRPRKISALILSLVSFFITIVLTLYFIPPTRFLREIFYMVGTYFLWR